MHEMKKTKSLKFVFVPVDRVPFKQCSEKQLRIRAQVFGHSQLGLQDLQNAQKIYFWSQPEDQHLNSNLNCLLQYATSNII